MLLGQPPRQFRASVQPLAIQDQRAVRVQHVLFGTGRVIGRFGLPQAIPPRNDAIFGQSPAGAPAAMLKAQGNGRVQGTTIDARLAAGNDAPDAEMVFLALHAVMVADRPDRRHLGRSRPLQ